MPVEILVRRATCETEAEAVGAALLSSIRVACMLMVERQLC